MAFPHKNYKAVYAREGESSSDWSYCIFFSFSNLTLEVFVDDFMIFFPKYFSGYRALPVGLLSLT